MSMMDGKSETVRSKLVDLLTPLPPAMVSTAYHAFDWNQAKTQTRVGLAQQAMIDVLNAGRPEKSKRLFTDLFEPVLCGDPIILFSDCRPPGLLHRFDISCLWDVLRRRFLAKHDAAIEETLGALSGPYLFEDALMFPAVRHLQREIRTAARCGLAHDLRDGRRRGALLDSLNARRRRECQRRLDLPVYPADMDETDLRLIISVLSAHPKTVKDFGKALRRILGRMEQGHNLLAIVDDLAGVAVGTQLPASASTVEQPSDASGPVATMLVYRAEHFEVPMMLSDQTKASADLRAMTSQALLAQYRACCIGIRRTLETALRLEEGRSLGILYLPGPVRQRLLAMQQRLGRLVAASNTAGRRHGLYPHAKQQQTLEFLHRFLIQRITRIVTKALVAPLADPGAYGEDFEDVVWLLGFTWKWRAIARVAGLSVNALESWRNGLLDDLGSTLAMLPKSCSQTDLDGRLGFLVRLSRVAAALDCRLSERAGLSSPLLLNTLMDAMARRRDLAPEIATFVTDVVRAARKELSGSNGWFSQDLSDFVQTARRRGY